MTGLVDKLARQHDLEDAELLALIEGRSEETARYLCARARAVCDAVYGRQVFLRGLVEISNYCRNGCYYCGIRAGNKRARRYRLRPEEILACCDAGYAAGLRTFVLQGGEDPFFTDEVLCRLVAAIKGRYPDCALTLSLGERGEESYRLLRQAGADRYLLRHETADPAHYGLLHPPAMSFSHRMECLATLKRLGYQCGCGFMVGSPGQTTAHLVRDLRFIKEFRPHMVGVGPFVPHRDTPFAAQPAGCAGLTVYLLAIIRLLLPDVLLPATTALGTVEEDGQYRGILAGANVIMPNLSPAEAREKYMLYNNKKRAGSEAVEGLQTLRAELSALGFATGPSRGDCVRRKEN